MWNGFWKLTVMVGVIGVGLYAAFQAQLGMNRSSFFATKTSVANTSESDSTEVTTSNEESSSVGVPAEDSADLFSQTESEPTQRGSQQKKKKVVEALEEFADGIADEQIKLQTASSKSTAQFAATKRTPRKGVDFREDVEEFDDSSSTPSSEPKSMNQEPSTDLALKRTRQKVQPANLQRAEEEKAAADADVNPFEEEVSDNKMTTKAVEKSSDVASSPKSDEVAEPDDSQREPGRARITTELSADGDIPRSKRAKKNAGKRFESTVEAEANPTRRELKVIQTSSVSDSPSDDATPVLGSPELLDDSTDPAPTNKNIPNPISEPRGLPADPMGDDATTSRSTPRRSRAAQPPAELNLGPQGNSPLRSRESLLRQSESDRALPLDMVGDGEIGDQSLRGLQQPRLSIEKITQQQAVLEQPLVYTIVVKNTGAIDAHNVVIEDRIPKGTELQGTSPQAELSGKRLIWNYPLLKPNEEKKISIKVIPKQEGPIGSVARVYFATEVTHEILVMAPQLEFTVKAPSEVRIGQRFEMVFNLKNIGKVDANNIVVRDLVPDALKHEMGTDIECPIGKMAPQEVREIVLPVVAMKTGSIVNKAILTADSGIKRTLDSPIDVVGDVLVLTRTGQNRLYVERPVVFTNNIRNEGNQKAERVKIAEVVPAGMEFETASDGGKFDPVQRAVVWTLGPLAPGNDKSVTVKYVPKETGTVAAKITAVGNAGSTTAINSTIEVIGKPELQMETLSATGTVTVGEQITSRFQINNSGTASATNVQLRIKLPRELRLISVKGANFQQRDEYILLEPIGEIGPRKKVAYELTLEPVSEADAQIGLEISADHLSKPGRRVETIQIARDALK